MSEIFSRLGSFIPSGQTDFFWESHEHACIYSKTVIIAATADQAAALTYFLSQDPTLSPLLFPDLELMPYDQSAVSPEVIEERYRCLHAMATENRWLVITSPFAIGLKFLPWPHLLKDVVSLSVGQEFARSAMVALWKNQGYYQVPEVRDSLEFALRGEIIDWFPVGQDFPLRLSAPEDRLEKIRTFDPLTQRSLLELPHKRAYPARAIPLSLSDYPKVLAQFRRDFSDRNSAFYHSLSSSKYPSGLAFFMPLILGPSERLQTFFELVAHWDPHVLIHPQASKTHKHLWEKAQECFIQAPITYRFTPYTPEQLYLPLNFYDSLKSALFSSKDYRTPPVSQALTEVRQAIRDSTARVLFTVVQAPKVALLQQWLSNHNISEPFYVAAFHDLHSVAASLCWTVAPFEEICHIPHEKGSFWVVPYTALVNQILVIPELSAKGRKKSRTKIPASESWSHITYVIHEDHGIARYHGLKILSIDGADQEFMELEYADNGRLFLPTSQITALTPYQTAPDQVLNLHKLGQSKWTKERNQAEAVARDQAAELLEIYAKRAQGQAFVHTIPPQYKTFAQEFPFQETIDQERAISEVLYDLTQPKPMDRLICGDVGFGKTEVALRACFISAMNQKQVLFLAPTTLLAQQHYETLLERMSHWGLKIALLSRYTKKDQSLYEAIEIGSINIVVGTHSLLQPSRKYSTLGLVIVDEEHRFGVRDKEQLKKIRNQVHWLSMTATPIPRTLSMSLQGLRDLSLMATPPVSRRTIVTTIHENTHDLVKHALERELFRSGQVYYLCNNILKIPKKVELLRALCPQARIGFVHGQMPHVEMEHQMNLFYQHVCDVLVCTTIIETGIDVAKAHTILIEDAHEFGLAQLHQLRGRVGRSHHQAYAYGLIPVPFHELTPISASRLQAFSSYQDLGSGYHIATHDLDLRGAGEVLGERQSGHIHQIGLDYYQTLLERASNEIQSQGSYAPPLSLKLDFGVQPRLSERQISDPVLRMKLYRQWALLTEDTQWIAQSYDFEDRFGKSDQVTARWQMFHRLRIMAMQLQISELSWTSGEMRIAFHLGALSMDRCIQWLQKGQLKAYPKTPLCLALKIATTTYDRRAKITENFLIALNRADGVLDPNWLKT